MDNLFSSPDLSGSLTKKKINCCGTIRPNRNDKQQNLGWKNLRIKQGDNQVSTTGHLRALIWKDKRDAHMWTNMHNPPVEGNA
jgi:hypothetical protein